MWAGLRSEAVDIMRYVFSQNDTGEQVQELVKVYEIRAKVEHMSGSRSVRNEEIIYPYQKRFVFRYKAPVNEDNLIRWQNNLWRVLSIDNDRDMMQCVVLTEIVQE